jgi:hypothetical protein
MRQHRVNRIAHKIYDPDDALPDGMIVQTNWREGEPGDWVTADDDCVIQILRRGRMHRTKGKKKIREYVGTCTGTFIVSAKSKMDTSRRENIYSFGGTRHSDDILLDRTNLSTCEHAFVLYMSQGIPMDEAYLKAFPTDNRRYAFSRAKKLVKTERINTAMKEELKPVLEELGINESYVLEKIKATAETADKEDVRLRALFKLSDIMDLEDKNETKVTQVTGALFQGFTPDELENVERPKEIEDGSSDSKSSG